MRIVLLGHYNSSEQLTGPEKVAKRLFHEIAKVNQHTSFVEYFFDGKKYSYWDKLFGKQIISEKLKITRLGLISFFVFLIKSRPDVIYIVKFERFQIVIFLYKLFFSVNIVYTANGIATHENIHCNDSPNLFQKLKDRFVESLIYKYSNHLIFLSQKSIRIAQQYFVIDESKIKIMANGIDEIFFENYYQERKNTVIKAVFVGGFSRQEKGLDKLLDALKSITVKIELHIIGDKFCELNFPNSNLTIVWHSKFSTEEYASFLSDKDIFISASKYESFSISAAEGIASGLVPFFTSETGLSELISHISCGYYFPFENINKINEYLISFSENREQHIKRKNELYKVIIKLNWSNIAQKYMQLCE